EKPDKPAGQRVVQLVQVAIPNMYALGNRLLGRFRHGLGPGRFAFALAAVVPRQPAASHNSDQRNDADNPGNQVIGEIIHADSSLLTEESNMSSCKGKAAASSNRMRLRLLQAQAMMPKKQANASTVVRPRNKFKSVSISVTVLVLYRWLTPRPWR